jgi:arginyl-tRNA--protein-N-Asp/Glu arginylyltransferase
MFNSLSKHYKNVFHTEINKYKNFIQNYFIMKNVGKAQHITYKVVHIQLMRNTLQIVLGFDILPQPISSQSCLNSERLLDLFSLWAVQIL